MSTIGTTITALPTFYAGCRFRSRIEARWVVFFDAAVIPWEYERQGFSLPAGSYLPDFWLPSIHDGAWFEVKGAPPTGHENQLAQELAVLDGHDVFIAHGPIPRSAAECADIEVWMGGDDHGLDDDGVPGWDSSYCWQQCPVCGRVGLEFAGYPGRICRHANEDMHGESPLVDAALRAARSARFDAR